MTTNETSQQVGAAQLLAKYRRAEAKVARLRVQITEAEKNARHYDALIKLATGRTQSWADDHRKIKREKACALMLAQNGKSVNDIAHILGISVSQTRSRLKQARKQA